MITISEKGEITITFDSSLSEEVTVEAAKADTTIGCYIVDAIAAAIERGRGLLLSTETETELTLTTAQIERRLEKLMQSKVKND